MIKYYKCFRIENATPERNQRKETIGCDMYNYEIEMVVKESVN